MSYQSYDPRLIVDYQLGILDHNIRRIIPASTLDNWKSRDTGCIIGLEKGSVTDGHKALFQKLVTRRSFFRSVKALLLVFQCYDQLLALSGLPVKKMKAARKVIVQTIAAVQPLTGPGKPLRWLKINRQRYHRWKRQLEKPCGLSLIELCFGDHPQQLTISEVSKIRYWCRQPRFAHWSLKHIWYQLMREGILYCGLSTFYRYAKLLGISRPGEILHLDVTHFRLPDHSKVYIYLVVDNFSRAVLSSKISEKLSAARCLDNLKNAIRAFSHLFPPERAVKVMSDGGPENKGTPIRSFFNDPQQHFQQIIAQKDIRFSNSMVESVIQHLKYYYLYRQQIQNRGQLEKALNKSIPDYQHKPHGAIDGFTPLEVVNGKIPDKYAFSEKIRAARTKRIEENRKNRENRCKECE